MSAVPEPAPAAMELGAPLADVAILPCSELRSEVVSGYRPRDATVRHGLVAADMTAVLVASLTTHVPATGTASTAWTVLALPAWVLLFKAYGLYEGDIKRFTRGTLHDLPAVTHAVLVGSVLFWLYAKAMSLAAVDLGALPRFAVVAAVGVHALRVAARRMLRDRLGPERAVIVGTSASIPLLARKLAAHPEYGVELVGVVGGADTSADGGPAVLGHPSALDLADVIARHRIDRVILAGSDAIPGTVADLVRRAHRLGLKVDYLPDPLDVLGAGVEVDDIEGVTVFTLYPPVLSRSSRVLKRAMDIVGAVAGLLITALPMLVIAAVVKLDSAGPVLFRHVRIGRGGRPFVMPKFRTMADGAEGMTEQLCARSRDPHWLRLEHDPRVTRAGRFLRLWSLDELPQLWSVLKGDMSLVGPRPLIEAEDRQITGWGRGRLDLTPGLTGLWQVLGRTCIPFEEMVRLDYVYVSNWSAWRDVQLLLRTLPALLTRRGAN
jgi:exopolysaccharide biosynthesis polyprenyl glycosylphosphotransferase